MAGILEFDENLSLKGSSIGLGFFNPEPQLRRTDVTGFCLQFPLSYTKVTPSGPYQGGGTWGIRPRHSNKGAKNQGFEHMNLLVFKLEN